MLAGAVTGGGLTVIANAPNPAGQSILQRYKDLRDRVIRSVDLVTPEKAGRRVIYLNNPGRSDVAAAVGWLCVAYGGFVLLLALIPNPLIGRLAFIGCGALVVGVGALLLFTARRTGNPS